ncbi:uncharacterized protein [Henckelia pumila]|uniref:uncharacterized protein n=1 Tax=Henckelia pumila TaxID=405737 RepID=UPI003C6DD658
MDLAVELGEYDIEYQPRKVIKAQALSDFLTEVVTFGQEEVWRIFVDGASGIGGSGVGVILSSPTQEKIKIVVKLDFQVSNNEAEYKANSRDEASSGSRGEPHHSILRFTIGGSASEEILLYPGIKIPREQNAEADALAKSAATRGREGDKEFIVQKELVASIEAQDTVSSEDTWMTPILEHLTIGALPSDEGQARMIRRQTPRFALLGGILYRPSYQGPMIRCLEERETEYVLREADASQIARSCEGCQRFGNSQHSPASNFKPLRTSCPFDQWGLDIVGPFSQARAQNKFLLVAVDYFSKWIEAEPLAKITEGEVMKFLWKNMVCRFRLPRKLVSDNGRQFQGQKLADWCAEMCIKHAFTLVVYPQSNGQT